MAVTSWTVRELAEARIRKGYPDPLPGLLQSVLYMVFRRSLSHRLRRHQPQQNLKCRRFPAPFRPDKSGCHPGLHFHGAVQLKRPVCLCYFVQLLHPIIHMILHSCDCTPMLPKQFQNRPQFFVAHAIRPRLRHQLFHPLLDLSFSVLPQAVTDSP